MKIIAHSKFVTVVSYRLAFDYEGEVNFGFSFECDKNGKVDESKLRPAGLENYKKCLTGQVGTRKVVCVGVDRREHNYREPAVGRCVCGRNVELGRFTNSCDCGRDYNGSGQELAPRSQWGEETGESWVDLQNL
jgi:hypothetical protein